MSNDYHVYPYGPVQAPMLAGQPVAPQGQAAGYAAQGFGAQGFQAQGHGPAGAYYAAYPQGMAAPMQGQMQMSMAPGYSGQTQQGTLFGLTSDRFLKGLLIGAAATYLLTNESVQRTAIKGVVKAWSMVQGGLEEVKERFQDAEAELHAAETTPGANGASHGDSGSAPA